MSNQQSAFSDNDRPSRKGRKPKNGAAMTPATLASLGSLMEYDQWVNWELVDTRKIPMCPNGTWASSSDSQTWSSFAKCQATGKKIGFVFSSEDPFVGIDLDGCRDKDTGLIEAWALEILAKFNTYAEVSPSGKGVKLFGKSTKKWMHKNKVSFEGNHCGIEVYDSGRFFCVTGESVEAEPLSINDVTQQLEWLAEKYAMQNAEPAHEAYKRKSTSNSTVERASAYVSRMPHSISGSNGHNAAIRVAHILVNGFNLALQDAREVFNEFNARCEPPWSEKEIEHKLKSASNYDCERGWLVSVNSDQWADFKIPAVKSVSSCPVADDRPEVLLTLAEGTVADHVVEHIGKLGANSVWIPERIRDSVQVFVRGGALVHAVESEDVETHGVLQIRQLPASLIRERITQACQLITERTTKDGIERVPTRPPRWLVDAIHQRGFYGGCVRPLVGVVQAPTLRDDGTILQSIGYDDASGLIYRPNTAFPAVPESPTKLEAKEAIESLSHVVVDFPFVDAADRSGWLSMVLSMIGRPAVSGCVPMFTIGANIRGAGKSLLADAASLIAYGRPASRKTFTRDDDEQRKLITSIAMESTACVLFDNLDVQLRGANIDAALTAKTWNDRVLGASKTTGELPLRTVWIATGNNISYGSDVARRVLPIRLESALESPEDRAGFVHPNLLEWVASNRPRLAVAALTILRAYFVAGCPEQSGGVWGSFEDWTRVIRGALVWAGAADPLPTRKSATECDETKNLLGMMITGLIEADPKGAGLTTVEIERIVKGQDLSNPECPTLLEAVGEVCGGERWNSRRFGRKLLSFKNRIWDGMRIDSVSSRGGVQRWIVRNGGFGGYGGLSTPQPIRVESISSGDKGISNAHGERGENNPANPSNPPSTETARVRVSGVV